jgi:dephospho-CoA kinase
MEQPTSKSSSKSKHSLKIGLTGGIGAGKSIVAKVFETIGIPVFDADRVGKTILSDDLVAREQIIQLLGSEAYDKGIPNRKFIAEMIFNNDPLRTSLNNIIHPKVANEYETWVRNNSESAYTIKESAISFETGIYKKLDANILVVAPEQLRIERVMKRDNTDLEAVKKRMDAQWSDEVKITLTDFVVTNDEKSGVLPQVLEIHKKLLRISENKR